jgi:hypothetical protein
MSEPEMREVYEKMKDKLEIVAINQNKLSEWQKHEFSKRIVREKLEQRHEGH